MIGRTIGSYRILEKLGGGGMGVVYKAHDDKLDRTVALKFLPPHLAGSESRKQRFVREARAASALDHTNVCTIYDIDETDDGQMYIAMGYCAGTPLDERIAAGPLPIDSCVVIATRIAQGLASAHAGDIVHRDIKPANIIVTDGDDVKIVDFGLAKLLSETALTQEGTTVGTVAYMSPEQARGQDVDHRTDIWSLGAVLYEMVTGRRAFGAEHDAAQLYLITNEDPAPAQSLRADVPAALAALIHGMLEKDASKRPQSARDVVAALGDATEHEEPEEEAHDTLVRARAARDRRDWSGAFAAYRDADAQTDLSPEDLESLGHAAVWTSNPDAIHHAWERAHALYVKAGRTSDAARVAIELAHDAFGCGRRSVCNGWLKRAEALLKNLPDVVENGLFARLRAQIAIEADIDLDAALAFAETVSQFAELCDNADLRAYGLQDRGRALVLKDQVSEGMELLEEAMSMAIAGEISARAVGSTYCNMISMCDRIADYRRAGEWGESAARWCAPDDESAFPGICSVHRADLMRVRGAWDEADGEAARAIDACEGFLPGVVGEGYYLKGEIRVRRGEFDEAEACFQEAHQRGRQPDPGLALLRLAQGNVKAARSLIDRALAPDLIALDRIKLLPAGVSIALAASDVETARSRANELQSLALGYNSTVFLACAAQAEGAVALAQGNAEKALASFAAACTHWKEAEMPHDEARTRALMAEAYWGGGEGDLADLEARAAQKVFEQLGAGPDLERINALIEQHS